LSGANVADPEHNMLGGQAASPSRMAWLENYCRKNPLDTFVDALVALRKDLIAQ
jgi:hypothetical protein